MWIYCKDSNTAFNTQNIFCVFATQNSIDILDKAGMQTSIKENINEDTANKIVREIMSAIKQDEKVYILD